MSAEEARTKTDADWRAILTPEQFQVTRQGGTERAWTSPLNDEKRPGVFTCTCCGTPLFQSDHKFDSGSGWPSFFQPASDGAVSEHRDVGHGMVRTEVRCKTCDAHLGHVFNDPPKSIAPTGLRYCINGVSLGFKPAE